MARAAGSAAAAGPAGGPAGAPSTSIADPAGAAPTPAPADWIEESYAVEKVCGGGGGGGGSGAA
jgi:hypothetical protein